MQVPCGLLRSSVVPCGVFQVPCGPLRSLAVFIVTLAKDNVNQVIPNITNDASKLRLISYKGLYRFMSTIGAVALECLNFYSIFIMIYDFSCNYMSKVGIQWSCITVLRIAMDMSQLVFIMTFNGLWHYMSINNMNYECRSFFEPVGAIVRE